MRKLIKNRKGTAEVIGTIMFIVILLFFFTNVYLWHDAATRDANELFVKKMNAGMSISFSGTNVIVNATSSDVKLSRLWIDTSSNHVYVDLGSKGVQVSPGDTHALVFVFDGGNSNTDGSVKFDPSGNTIYVHYTLGSSPRFTIVNTLGVAVYT
jgi:hypothetical protein